LALIGEALPSAWIGKV